MASIVVLPGCGQSVRPGRESQFMVARMVIEARRRPALTQAELAERMETTQSVVARLESGRIHPSTRTLERIARATGTRASNQSRSSVMQIPPSRNRLRRQVRL